MMRVSERFPARKENPPEGTRGPSGKRMTMSKHNLSSSLPSLNRGPLFGSLSRKSTTDSGSTRSMSKSSSSPVFEKTEEEKAASHGKLCAVCGDETAESGKGLRQCPTCHSIQLASGFASHTLNMTNPGQGLQDAVHQLMAKHKIHGQFDDAISSDVVVDNGLGPSNNHLAHATAWRRVSMTGHAEMAMALSGCLQEEDKQPVMAGIVNTGYAVGDRVKTTLRLPGAAPSKVGWDPITPESNEGTVTGPGRVPGEIMVKFDHCSKDHVVSMKMSQLTHVKTKEPIGHLERSFRRKAHLKPSGKTL